MTDQETNKPDDDRTTSEETEAPAASEQDAVGQSPESMASDALQAAEAAIAGLKSEGSSGGAKAFNFESLKAEIAERVGNPDGLALISDVNLNVKIELGRTRMVVDDVLKLAEGCVVELDKLAGDPVDVFVNDRHVARGEVLVLNDNFCVRINEILVPGGAAVNSIKKR